MNLFCYTKNILARRKGISQIIGSLFMLAIVVPIGTVILSQGLYEIADFNKFLSTSRDQGIAAVQEDIIFEHIRFEPTGDQVTISVRNISLVESFIEKITIVRMDSQELLLYQDNFATTLPLKTGQDISVNANLPPGRWDDADYVDKDYKISITTLQGNFFETIARPFNT